LINVSSDILPTTDAVDSSLGSASFRFLDAHFQYLRDQADVICLTNSLRQLHDTSGVVSVEFDGRQLIATGGIPTVDWGSRILNDENNDPLLEWTNGAVIFTGNGRFGLASGTDFASSWGADIPGILFDQANDANVATASGGGMFLKSDHTTSLAFLTSDKTGSGSATVYMQTGSSDTAPGSGSIDIVTGNATSTANSGDVRLQTGTVASGTRGRVVVTARTIRLPKLASAPTATESGEMYYDTTTNKSYTWDGSTWQAHW
jgi:hypothetical protein